MDLPFIAPLAEAGPGGSTRLSGGSQQRLAPQCTVQQVHLPPDSSCRCYRRLNLLIVSRKLAGYVP